MVCFAFLQVSDALHQEETNRMCHVQSRFHVGPDVRPCMYQRFMLFDGSMRLEIFIAEIMYARFLGKNGNRNGKKD